MNLEISVGITYIKISLTTDIRKNEVFKGENNCEF